MHKYSLIELLWLMKRGELLHVEYGICYHLELFCADTSERMRAKQWMYEWPENSGCAHYPVPAPDGEAPENAYDAGLPYDALWVGAYGASRKRLLNYLITRAQEVYHA